MNLQCRTAWLLHAVVTSTALYLVSTTPLRADVLVNSAISITSLTITPQNGSLIFLPPTNSPVGCTSAALCATAFAQAQDSVGGFDQQYHVADNGTASTSAATGLANALATASAPALTASASSGIHIVGIDASASSVANGNPASLVGTFEVTQATMLDVSAMLSVDQTLFTDFFGILATSEVVFSLQLDNGDVPLFFDQPLFIGPSSSMSSVLTPSLTGTTSLLQADTPYTLFIQTDAESFGVNAAVPEPGSLMLTLSALGLLAAWRRSAVSFRVSAQPLPPRRGTLR